MGRYLVIFISTLFVQYGSLSAQQPERIKTVELSASISPMAVSQGIFYSHLPLKIGAQLGTYTSNYLHAFQVRLDIFLYSRAAEFTNMTGHFFIKSGFIHNQFFRNDQKSTLGLFPVTLGMSGSFNEQFSLALDLGVAAPMVRNSTELASPKMRDFLQLQSLNLFGFTLTGSLILFVTL